MSFRRRRVPIRSELSAMNTDEEDSRCWNFIQIAAELHTFLSRARRFLLASTSRKFSPPTRPTPARACSPPRRIPAKFAGKSSRPPCIHSRRPVYVTVGAVSRTTTDHADFHGDRVLSCTNDCALSISRVKVISEVAATTANLTDEVILPFPKLRFSLAPTDIFRLLRQNATEFLVDRKTII